MEELLAIGSQIPLFVAIVQLDLPSFLHQLDLLQLSVYDLFDHESQAEVRRVVLSYEAETSVDLWVDFKEELESGHEVGDGYEHADIQHSAIRHSLFEGNSEDLADEEGLLADSSSFPADHQLSHKTAVVAALLFVELNRNGLARHLVKSHVEGTAARDQDVLAVDILVILWYFEAQPDLLR